MNLRLGIDVISMEPTPAVVWALRVGRLSLQAALEEGIGKVRRAVTAARVPSSGPPFVRYLSLRPQLALEVGLPLAGPHAVPTLRATILPGGLGATLWRAPGRDSMAVLEEWIRQNAEPAGDPWEWYWTEPDAPEPRVQIVWPVRLR